MLSCFSATILLMTTCIFAVPGQTTDPCSLPSICGPGGTCTPSGDGCYTCSCEFNYRGGEDKPCTDIFIGKLVQQTDHSIAAQACIDKGGQLVTIDDEEKFNKAADAARNEMDKLNFGHLYTQLNFWASSIYVNEDADSPSTVGIVVYSDANSQETTMVNVTNNARLIPLCQLVPAEKPICPTFAKGSPEGNSPVVYDRGTVNSDEDCVVECINASQQHTGDVDVDMVNVVTENGERHCFCIGGASYAQDHPGDPMHCHLPSDASQLEQLRNQLQPTTQSPLEEVSTPVTASHDLPYYAQLMLDTHNDYRENHGADPLTIDLDLMVEAQRWADHLANITELKHAPYQDRDGQGENLASFDTSTDTSTKNATDLWYNEIRDYDFAAPGWHSATDQFTQLVWRGTKQLGVGLSVGSDGTAYIVARYRPSGNFIGQFADNVLNAIN